MPEALFVSQGAFAPRARRQVVSPRAVLLLAVLACLCLPVAGRAQPQDQRQAGLRLEIDFDELLMSSRVTATTWKDSVYTVEPNPGRRLIQVPLRVDTSGLSEPIEVDDPYIDVDGARFLMWSLLGHSEQRNFDNEPAKKLDGVATDDDGNKRPLTDQMPYVNPELVLTPAGRVKWEIQRFMPNTSTGNKDNLYVLLVDAQKLRELHPGRPPRLDRGDNESSRAFRMRQSQAFSQYRVKTSAYRDLRDQVRSLPEQFEADLPGTLWAIYELPDFRDTLRFTGPEPLPWEITLSGLQTVRRLVGSARQRNDDQGALQEARIAAELNEIVSDDHPYSHRVVAQVLSRRGMIPRIQPGSQAYQLALSILNGPDDTASNIVLKETVTTIPPTAATRALLSQVTRKLDPQTKLLSLKGALAPLQDGQVNVASVVGSVNAALQDVKGAPADMVLAEVLEAARTRTDMIASLAGRIRFDALPEGRQRQAIAEVVSRAHDNTLAQLWLDRQLLSSADPAVVSQTLETIIDAQAGNSVVKPVVGKMLGLMFGKPKQETASAEPTAALKGPIPIASTNHGLFRVLRSGDPQTRTLAWRALPAFVLTSEAASPNGTDAYDVLVRSALELRVTPISVVPFLLNQRDPMRVTRELVRLVNDAEYNASKAASAALMGRDARVLGSVLRNLSVGERHGFAARMYRNAFGVEPTVTGLLRQRADNDRAVMWFAQQISDDVLPPPRAWAEIYDKDDTALLGMVASQDDELAKAAVAALVAMAGGRQADIQPTLEALRAIPDASLEALSKQWATIRQGIYAERLTKAQGSYRLVLDIQPGDDRSSMAQPQRIVVAIVEFESVGKRIGFANSTVELAIPDSFLAIRVKDPAQLKSFPNEALLDLPLEDATQNVDLLPQAGGVWSGQFRLPGGRTATLGLVPEDR